MTSDWRSVLRFKNLPFRRINLMSVMHSLQAI